MSTRDLLRANDARFQALAGGFSADEWSQPSLCDGWSNHDVLAHLVVGYGAGPGVVTSEMLRHGGSFDRANAALARSLATTRSPGELLDDFGRLTRRPRGLGRYFPPRLLLGDHITHELDILFALNRSRPSRWLHWLPYSTPKWPFRIRSYRPSATAAGCV